LYFGLGGGPFLVSTFDLDAVSFVVAARAREEWRKGKRCRNSWIFSFFFSMDFSFGTLEEGVSRVAMVVAVAVAANGAEGSTNDVVVNADKATRLRLRASGVNANGFFIVALFRVSNDRTQV